MRKCGFEWVIHTPLRREGHSVVDVTRACEQRCDVRASLVFVLAMKLIGLEQPRPLQELLEELAAAAPEHRRRDRRVFLLDVELVLHEALRIAPEDRQV